MLCLAHTISQFHEHCFHPEHLNLIITMTEERSNPNVVPFEHLYLILSTEMMCLVTRSQKTEQTINDQLTLD